MKRWLSNLLGGAATVLELSPPPIRHRFGARYLSRTMEDDFRQDMENVARDMNAAIGAVYGHVNHVNSGHERHNGSTLGTALGADNGPSQPGQQ